MALPTQAGLAVADDPQKVINSLRTATTQNMTSEQAGVDDDVSISFSEDGEETIKSDSGVAPATDATAPNTDQSATASAPTEKNNEAVFDIPDSAPAAETAEKPAPVEKPGLPQKRDYSKYPAELIPVLKDLPNAKFAQYADTLAETFKKAARVAELEKTLAERPTKPQYFYENPEGYRLTPEFASVQTELGYAQLEASHWQEQLPRIMRGEDWIELTGYDQNNRPVYEKRAAPANGVVDAEAQVRVQQMLTGASSQYAALRQQQAGIMQQYQRSVQNVSTEMQTIDNKLFPKLARGEEDMSAEEKEHFKLAKSIAPAYFENHPLVPILGKSFVMYMRLAKMLTAEIKKREVAEAQLAGRARSEVAPTNVGVRPTPTGANADDDEIVKFEDI